MRKREGSTSLTLFRVNVLPHIAATFYGILRLLAWILTFSMIYVWITLSLRRFPYTEPWGKQAGSYVLNSLRDLANTVLNGLPGLLTVGLIFIATRWLVRMANVLFEQVATGRISLTWMDADVAHATKRIFSAIAWIFADHCRLSLHTGIAYGGIQRSERLFRARDFPRLDRNHQPDHEWTVCGVFQGTEDRRMGEG